MSNCITTYTGKHFDPTQPEKERICIDDIAHALSLLCRGNGHVKTFFSVGQHCILCAKEAMARGLPRRLALAALLHDASECYMSDVPRPFKKSLPKYQRQEEKLLCIIYEKYLDSVFFCRDGFGNYDAGPFSGISTNAGRNFPKIRKPLLYSSGSFPGKEGAVYINMKNQSFHTYFFFQS